MAAGLLVIAVPPEHGGLGLDMLTYCMVIEKLAAGCANTGMTVHMHSTVMRFIEALATPQQKAALYPEVVEGGQLFGSWGSEPERRGGTRVSETVIVPDEDGYVINGRKHFCTLAGGAHRYMIHCAYQGGPTQTSLLLALARHDTPGIRVLDEWNTLGMRATISPAWPWKTAGFRLRWSWANPAKLIGAAWARGSASALPPYTWVLRKRLWIAEWNTAEPTILSRTPRRCPTA